MKTELLSRAQLTSSNWSYHGNKYIIQERGDGIYWEKLQNLQQELSLTPAMIKKMNISNLQQVSLIYYNHNCYFIIASMI